MHRAVSATFIAISIGACNTDETPTTRPSDAGTDTKSGSGGHESGIGKPTGDAVALDAHDSEADPVGPRCEYEPGAFNRIPACKGLDGGVPRSKGLTCNASLSFPFECPNFLVAGTHLTGCCVYGSFSDCGLTVVRSDGQSYCGAFYPPGSSTPDCPDVMWGSEVLAGCRVEVNGQCGAHLVADANGVVLDFGCVPGNLLPRIDIIDPG